MLVHPVESGKMLLHILWFPEIAKSNSFLSFYHSVCAECLIPPSWWTWTRILFILNYWEKKQRKLNNIFWRNGMFMYTKLKERKKNEKKWAYAIMAFIETSLIRNQLPLCAAIAELNGMLVGAQMKGLLCACVLHSVPFSYTFFSLLLANEINVSPAPVLLHFYITKLYLWK